MSTETPQRDEPPWRVALAAQMLVVQISWVGARIMLGYRAIELGGDAVFVALLASAFAAPALAGSVVIGRLADRFGGATIALLGSALMALGCIAPLAAHEQWLLLVAAGAAGLGSVGVFVGQQTFVAHRTRGLASDGDFGTLATAGSVGQLIAPPLVTALAALAASPTRPDTSIGLALCAVAAALATVPAAVLRRIDHDAPGTSHAGAAQSPLSVLRTPGLWRAIAVSSAMLVTMDLLYSFIPLWAAEHSIDATVVGWLLALRALVSVASRVGLGRMVARFGRKSPLVLSMACGVVALAALPVSDAVAAVAVMIALGVCLGVPQPLTLAWVVEIVAARDHGAALGLRMAGNRLAQTVIPLGMTVVAAPLGVAGVIWANALLLALASALAAAASPGGPQARSRVRR